MKFISRQIDKRIAAYQRELIDTHYKEVDNMYRQMRGWRHDYRNQHRWAIAHQLSWIEDESNQDDAYDRNFLRLRIVPLLNARWPHFAEAVARSASLCGEQERLLDEMLAAELATLERMQP